jgi:uncharacterized ferritin-like protein (DUF455 family)
MRAAAGDGGRASVGPVLHNAQKGGRGRGRCWRWSNAPNHKKRTAVFSILLREVSTGTLKQKIQMKQQAQAGLKRFNTTQDH